MWGLFVGVVFALCIFRTRSHTQKCETRFCARIIYMPDMKADVDPDPFGFLEHIGPLLSQGGQSSVKAANALATICRNVLECAAMQPTELSAVPNLGTQRSPMPY